MVEEGAQKHKKCHEFIKILTLISYKKVSKILSGNFPPVFGNSFAANILRMWGRRGVLYLQCWGVLLPSEPVTQYRFMKTDDNDSTHKNMQMPYLDMWSMLFFWTSAFQVSYSSNLFWNLEDALVAPVL